MKTQEFEVVGGEMVWYQKMSGVGHKGWGVTALYSLVTNRCLSPCNIVCLGGRLWQVQHFATLPNTSTQFPPIMCFSPSDPPLPPPPPPPTPPPTPTPPTPPFLFILLYFFYSSSLPSINSLSLVKRQGTILMANNLLRSEEISGKGESVLANLV